MAVAFRYSLGQAAAILRCQTQLRTANRTDDLWVDYLSTVDADDFVAQRDVVLDLADALLAAMSDAASGLETLAVFLEAARAEEIDDAFALLRQRDPRVVAAFDTTFAEVLDEYDHRGMLVDACSYLREVWPQEQAVVEAKRAAIEAGKLDPDPLSAAAKCAISIGLVGSGVALVVMTGGGAAALAVGGVHELTGAVLAFDDGGCQTCVKKIWSRLH